VGTSMLGREIIERPAGLRGSVANNQTDFKRTG
jgi:hypothetical protein